MCCVDLFEQENERRREEKDERKRKYNVKWNDEVRPLVPLSASFCFLPPILAVYSPVPTLYLSGYARGYGSI